MKLCTFCKLAYVPSHTIIKRWIVLTQYLEYHPTAADTVSPRLLVSKILGEVGQFEL